jgi:hypothetical protein
MEFRSEAASCIYLSSVQMPLSMIPGSIKLVIQETLSLRHGQSRTGLRALVKFFRVSVLLAFVRLPICNAAAVRSLNLTELRLQVRRPEGTGP